MSTATPAPLTQRLPRKAVRSLSELAVQSGLNVEDALFLALRKLGWTQGEAYLGIRPEVTQGSATTLGSKRERELAQHELSIDFNGLMAVLADYRILEALSSQQPADIRLKAADMANKLLGRYNDPTISINLFAGSDAVPQARTIETVDVDVPAPDDV